jgi:site-specific DNA recombinase
MRDGTCCGGQKLSRGALYLMLQNRIYRGEMIHKGNAYPGEHPAIVDKALWDEVQTILSLMRIAVTGIELKRTVYLYGVAGRQRTAVAAAMMKMLRAYDWSSYAAV